MNYPVRYRITKSVLEEWQMSERGSWEDHHCPDIGHVFNVLCRAKTTLIISNREEAGWLVHSAYYQGDTCGICDDLIRSHAAIGRYGEKIAEDLDIPFA